MKNKLIGALLVTASAAALQTGCATEQAEPLCLVGRGDYAVKYVLVPGSKTGTGDCDTLQGEILGVQRYSPPGGTPTVALRTTGENLKPTAYPFFAETAAGEPYQEALQATYHNDVTNPQETLAVGDFPETDAPNDQNLCEVGGPLVLKVATSETEGVVNAPESFDPVYEELEDGGQGELEGYEAKEDAGTAVYAQAGSATYTFENAKWYVAARSPGVTFQADLTYEQTKNGETCSAKYRAVGLWPAYTYNFYGTPCASDTDCDACADPLQGRPYGSGIIPDLDTFCQVSTGLCVLRSDELPGFLPDDEIKRRQEQCTARTAPGAATP